MTRDEKIAVVGGTAAGRVKRRLAQAPESAIEVCGPKYVLPAWVAVEIWSITFHVADMRPESYRTLVSILDCRFPT